MSTPGRGRSACRSIACRAEHAARRIQCEEFVGDLVLASTEEMKMRNAFIAALVACRWRVSARRIGRPRRRRDLQSPAHGRWAPDLQGMDEPDLHAVRTAEELAKSRCTSSRRRSTLSIASLDSQNQVSTTEHDFAATPVQTGAKPNRRTL
jgi:hypothetical protein